MWIRNLNLLHPENGQPEPDLTIETRGALSVLARWITDAEVQIAHPPWMNSPRSAGSSDQNPNPPNPTTRPPTRADPTPRSAGRRSGRSRTGVPVWIDLWGFTPMVTTWSLMDDS